nr:hypothetical protein [Gemmatimonadaceae bacterium]
MSGHDALRRYLEQRRDLGEREFTLDDLSVEDALSLLGAKRTTRRASAPPDTAPSTPPQASPNAPAPSKKFAFPAPPEADAPAVSRTPRAAAPEPPRPLPPEMLPEDAPGWLATLGVPLGLRVGDARTGRTTGTVAALESLEAVAAAAGACTACPLHSTATNVVPGEGNPDADFVCVGEAPGANEDAT